VPRKRHMTWQAGTGKRQGRWRKKYKGRLFQASGGRGKHDQEAYQAAWADFQEFKRLIDEEEALKPKPHQAEYCEAISQWNLVLQWGLENNDTQYLSIARRKIEELTNRLERPKPKPLTASDQFDSHLGMPAQLLESMTITIPNDAKSTGEESSPIIDPAKLDVSSMNGTPQRIEREIWKDRLKTQKAKQVEKRNTLGANIEAYLTTKRAQVEAGALTAGRYSPIETHLHHFRDWAGSESALTSISSEVLADYHAVLLNAISGKELSASYSKDRLTTVSTFIRWLWEIQAIEDLPRVLAHGSRILRITKTVSTPEVFTLEEVQKLFSSARDRTRLHLLLMLNCGSTQKDISDLRVTEVDWKRGTITRKRSKTAKHKGVPTVTYRLWKETFRLLKQEKSTDDERVLLNRKGAPLKVERLDENGKLQKIDNIASDYNRLRKRTGIKKPLKYFRKTSSTLIKSNKDYRGLEGLFLGHAPATVEERHYTQAPQKLLDEAIIWLGHQYGVE